jgi:3-oxoadipate enol-lactonase
MPVADLNGTHIKYEYEGDEGLPILMLSNSLTTNMHVWDEQVAEFAKFFRVLRYDNRGHGGSSSPLGEYTIDDIGGDLLSLMNILGIEKANLCGISLGGMVGMWMGINQPQRLEKLIICNTSSNLSPPAPWQDRINTVRAHGMSSIIDAGLQRFLSDNFRKIGSPKINLLKKMMNSCDVPGYVGCCAAVRDLNLDTQLQKIKIPTLIIAGEFDPSTPVSHSELINKEIEESRMVVINGVAHLSNIEVPEEFNKNVLDFLLN